MKKTIWVIGVLVVMAAVVFALGPRITGYAVKQPGKLDSFAQCLTDKGAIFYGAYWCPHCVNQKKAFGSSAEYLNYVECAIPNSGEQTAACDSAGIEGYPTWVFADGTRKSGEVSFYDLAKATGCTLG